jgi:hypothetical protein
MTQIIHHCDRISQLIAEGRTDLSPCWVEHFDGTVREARRDIFILFGRPQHHDGFRFRYDGFTLTIQE